MVGDSGESIVSQKPMKASRSSYKSNIPSKNRLLGNSTFKKYETKIPNLTPSVHLHTGESISNLDNSKKICQKIKIVSRKLL